LQYELKFSLKFTIALCYFYPKRLVKTYFSRADHCVLPLATDRACPAMNGVTSVDIEVRPVLCRWSVWCQ